MACKVFVNHPGSLMDEARVALQKKVADHLGVCPEDVVVLPGITLSVVEVPDALCAAREKADKAAAKESAEKAAAEEKAAKAAKDAEEKAAKESEKKAAWSK